MFRRIYQLLMCYALSLRVATSGEESVYQIRIQPSTLLRATEGESKAAVCSLSSPDVQKIEWTYPASKKIIESNLNRSVHVEDDGKFALRLIFANLTLENSGTYKCTVFREKITSSISKEFTLVISKKYDYGFEDDPKIHYVLYGESTTLQCRRKQIDSSGSSVLKRISSISWRLNHQLIVSDAENTISKDFVIADDEEKLYVKNVTNTTLGNYSCMLIVTNTGNVISREMQLKLASAPKMLAVHTNNTVHVPNSAGTSYVAYLVCKVMAEPPASLKWFRVRNDKEIEPHEFNITLEETITSINNQNVLRLPIKNRSVLGAYLCRAENSFGSSNVTIRVSEAETPIAPLVRKREGFESGYRLDIDQKAESKQRLSNYRVLYRRTDDQISTVWHHHDFQLSDSKTSPYSVNGLEPNTEYVFKVGACTETDLCAYTDESVFETTAAGGQARETANSAANIILNLTTLPIAHSTLSAFLFITSYVFFTVNSL